MFDLDIISKMNDGRPTPSELVDILRYYNFFNLQEKLGLVSRKTSKKSIELRKAGNDLYQRKEHSGAASHRKILSLYSQSIAHAPNGSEELALALGNRSALWMHLNKYELCLTDINRALSITASDELKNKLLTRKMKCLQLNQSTPQNCNRQNELPKFTRSELNPYTADCIKLEFNEEFGRHYVATRDIKPGEIIISEKSSYSFIQHQQMYTACSHCLAFAWAGIPCDSCVYAIYCSENCKNEAWSQYHDIQCTTTSFLTCEGLTEKNWFNFSRLVKMMIIAVRKDGLKSILKEAKKNRNQKGVNVDNLLSNDRLNQKECISVYNLATSIDKREQYLDEPITIVLSLLLTFLIEECGLEHCRIDCITWIVMMKAILKKLNSIRNCNSYGFRACHCDCASCSPDCLARRGAIVAPYSSLINHSCHENARRVFIPGPRIVMYTVRPIKNGEQIFVNYGPDSIKASKEDRQAILREPYGFVCQCQACVENWPTPPPPITHPQYKRLFAHLPDAGKYTIILKTIMKKYREEWQITKELFDDATVMLDVIYKNFDGQLAHIVAESLKTYMDACFSYFYCENVNMLETC